MVLPVVAAANHDLARFQDTRLKNTTLSDLFFKIYSFDIQGQSLYNTYWHPYHIQMSPTQNPLALQNSLASYSIHFLYVIKCNRHT